MYRSLGLAVVVASFMASAAVAADLPSRKYAPQAPLVVAPVFTWTGFYVGANAGVAFLGSQKRNGSLAAADMLGTTSASALVMAPGRSGRNTSSFTGGGQIGYNYQWDAAVIGVETDLNYARLSRTGVAGVVSAAGTMNASLRSEVEWFGTLRARLGFMPMDQLLVYATGGLAYGSVKARIEGTSGLLGVARGGERSASKTRVGWTLGAGVEYALTNNISMKGEYAYVDLGRQRHNASGLTFIDTAGQLVTANMGMRSDSRFHVVRAGLNYRF